MVKIGQLTDVSQCKFQQHLFRNVRKTPVPPASPFPGSRPVTSSPGPLALTEESAEEQEPMTMMAQAPTARPAFPARAEPQVRPAEPAELRHRRVRLATGAAAAAHASCHVQTAIAEWQLPVDSAVAAILASDLIINAARNGRGETLMLSIRCTATQFRVEVHDPSVTGDSWAVAESGSASGTESGTESGTDAERGLLLAAALAADYGHYRTPAGRAVFYTLAFAPAAAAGDEPPSRGAACGDGEP